MSAYAVRLLRLLAAAACALAVSAAGGFAQSREPPRDYADCLACHSGIEDIGPAHPLSCGQCHLTPQYRGRALADHTKILPNPSDPNHALQTCGHCHEATCRAVTRSLHATAATIINGTRFLWGAQGSAKAPRYSANRAFVPLPGPAWRPRTTAMLVDGFLRSQCLRCHIGAKGLNVPGCYRSTGCAACHVAYAEDGRYKGYDPVLDKEKQGRPARHGLARPRGDAQCLSCHNGNHVGGDYHGLFERDLAPAYQHAVSGGEPVYERYGSSYHRLARDVHAERGLTCLDCHTGRQVMGLADERPACAGCHGGYNRAGPDPNIAQIAGQGGTYHFATRQGEMLGLSLFKADSLAHDPKTHARLRCSACHGQWFFGDYGLSVARRDDLRANGPESGFPEMKGFLRPSQVDVVAEVPLEGVWFCAWRFRRWETAPLGVDGNGRISVLRPKYQYLVSYVDGLGNTVLDSVVPRRGDGQGPGWAFSAYTPHTTAPSGRPCHACHENPLAAGEGLSLGATVDLDLFKVPVAAMPGERPLSTAEREKLMHPGPKYRIRFAVFARRITECGQ